MISLMQPTFFISHGSPMIGIEKSKTSDFLQQLGKEISRPNAIVVFSAHFDRPQGIVISSGLTPKTIHDFYGFPKALYDIKYNAPGSPLLAQKIMGLFQQAGIQPILDSEQGWDHGVWMPLKLMYPEADIPVVAISINSQLSAKEHYEYGQLLSELRKHNVLIIGSGGISHNLRELSNPNPSANRVVRMELFIAWVHDKLLTGDLKALLNYQDEAPDVSFNHPTVEHFLPLFVALGSGDLSVVKRIHHDIEFDLLALDAYRFG
jgi:4,5-DOPA dioxygenase extradiol